MQTMPKNDSLVCLCDRLIKKGRLTSIEFLKEWGLSSKNFFLLRLWNELQIPDYRIQNFTVDHMNIPVDVIKTFATNGIDVRFHASRAIARQCFDTAKYLIAFYKLSIKDVNPYWIASVTKGTESYTFLIEHLGLSPDDIFQLDGYHCVLWNVAGKNNGMLQFLVDFLNITREQFISEHMNSLGEAAGSCGPNLKYLVETFALTKDDIRYNDNEALQYACMRGSLENVKFLINHYGLTIDDARFKNCWALCQAVVNEYPEVVQYLTSKFNFTLEDIRSNNDNIMKQAGYNRDVEMVEFFENKFGYSRKDVWTS